MDFVNINSKPDACQGCGLVQIGQGFVPCWSPTEPKIAFLGSSPGESAKENRNPLMDGTVNIIMHILKRNGMTASDVLVDNVLRCKTPYNMGYPSGTLKHSAENRCRMFDEALLNFEPTHYLLTIHPDMVIKTWQLIRVLEADILKALRLREKGHKILVLLGDEPKDLLLPNEMSGGIIRWRGTWGELDWSAFRKRTQRSIL